MVTETEYKRKLKIKKRQQISFRRFVRGEATPIQIRYFVGLNHWELKAWFESRMLPNMTWDNYGSYWVVDHIVPFWLFDVDNDSDMKLLWHPDNLLPFILKDNNHKQGDLRFSLSLLKNRKEFSYAIEKLMEKVEKEIKVQDKYLIIFS